MPDQDTHETAATPSDGSETTPRKPRFNPEQHLEEFKSMAVAGKNELEIRDQMKLSKLQFLELYQLLTLSTNQVFRITPAAVPGRRLKIKSTGITISLAQIETLGLADTFSKGKSVVCKKLDNGILVELINGAS